MNLTPDEKIKNLTQIVEDIASIMYFDNNDLKTYQYQKIKESIRKLQKENMKCDCECNCDNEAMTDSNLCQFCQSVYGWKQ